MELAFVLASSHSLRPWPLLAFACPQGDEVVALFFGSRQVPSRTICSLRAAGRDTEHDWLLSPPLYTF